MNQTPWNQLRGYINLKTALALGAIALVGAFVVKLPAQVTPPQNKPDCLACGVKNSARNETLKLFVPKQSKLVGLINGPFKDLATNSVVSKTVRVDADSSLAHLQLQPITNGIYRIDFTASSGGKDVYGISIGNDADESLRTTARFSEGSHTIRITGEIKGAVLGETGFEWGFFSEPQIKRPLLAKTEADKSGVKVAGTFRGKYIAASQAGQPVVDRTIDMNRKNELVVLNGEYFGNVVFSNQNRSDVYGASIANPKTQDTVLGAFTDVVQKQIQIQGLVQGSRFSNTIMAWGIIDFPAQMEKTKIGYNSASQAADICTSCGEGEDMSNSAPQNGTAQALDAKSRATKLSALTSAKIETRANAQVVSGPTSTPAPTSVPAATPTPTAPPTPTATPTRTPPPGGGWSSVIGFFTKVLDYVQGHERRGKSLSK